MKKSQKFRPQHLQFLEDIRNEDKVVMNGKFMDGAVGLVIYKAAGLKHIKIYVDEDPYVTEGARGCEIHKWDMVSNYRFIK